MIFHLSSVASEHSLRYGRVVAQRASPLPPDKRRAAIISATIPLLRLHGRAVTTAQISMASGVAEGTLFRAFPDKEALIGAAIESAFDPAPTERALGAIDPELPLREALIEVVEILQVRVEQIWQLLSMLGMTAPPPLPKRGEPVTALDLGIRAKIVPIFEAHRDELRCEPDQAMRILRAMTFAGSHPRMVDGTPFTAAEIVAIVLDGMRARPDEEVT